MAQYRHIVLTSRVLAKLRGSLNGMVTNETVETIKSSVIVAHRTKAELLHKEAVRAAARVVARMVAEFKTRKRTWK